MVQAQDWEKKDYVTYYGYTGNPITVAWDAVEGATSYEIKLQNVERNYFMPIQTVTECEITIFFQRQVII